VFDFWKGKINFLSLLLHSAMEIYPILATSSLSERLFSTGGDVITEKLYPP
jgi:hypothetical protein